MTSINLGRLGRITFTRSEIHPEPSDTAEAQTTKEPASISSADRAASADTGISAPEPQASAAEAPTSGLNASTSPEDDAESAAARSKAARIVRYLAATVAAILVVAMVSIGSFLTVSNHHRQTTLDQADQIKKAINSTVVSMLSYDYTTAKHDLPQAESSLTPGFRDDYQKLITATIIPGAEEKRVITKTTVAGSSIISQSSDNAQLLLFLNQVTTTSDNPQPSTTGSRVAVTAVKLHNSWLVDSLQPI